MTTKRRLVNSMQRSVASVYETDEFRDVLLIHLDLIQKRETNSFIDITQQEADMWAGDFYGLLISKGVRPHMLWLLTVFNGLSNSSDYDADFLEIKTPDTEYIKRLVDVHNTIHI